MLPGQANLLNQWNLLLLAGGVVGLLIAVTVMAKALVREGAVMPGRRALAYWLPIVVLVLFASVLGRPEMAISVIFGTSIAILSTVAGFETLGGPIGNVPSRWTAIWFLTPAAAVLAFLAGFRGTLGWFEALVLFLEGLLLGGLWLNPAVQAAEPASPEAPAAADPPMVKVLPQAGPVTWLTVLEVIGALVLAGLSAWAAIRGADAGTQTLRYPPAALAVSLLSVALAIPMITTGMPLAVQGKGWAATNGQILVVLLNLCILLPVVIAWPLAVRAMVPVELLPHWVALETPVAYPLAVWRIDAVGLMILSILLIPVAAGRLKLDFRVGWGLILAYGIYLLAVMYASTL